MAENRDDIASIAFEESPEPSRYMTSIVSITPSSRRAQTVNLDNPYNRGVAHPAYHVGIDSKDAPSAGDFSVRMAKLDDPDSQSLASAAAGRPNTYRPRAVVAAERLEKIIATSAKAAGGRKKTPVNPAPNPGRGDSSISESEEPAPRTSRRRAAVAGEKKRKRASLGEDDGGDAKTGPRDESEENTTQRTRGANCTLANTQAPIVATTALSFTPSGLLRKRDGGIKVPKSIDEACEADRMLWEWRHAGKPWADITRKWTELTGKTPGKSTLSVRFIKLQENFAQSGGADDLLLLQYKANAEAELENELWQMVSAKIKVNHDADITPNQLRKRYNALKQSGFEIGGEVDIDMDADDAQAEPTGGLQIDAAQDRAVQEAADTHVETERMEEQGPAPLVDYSNSESEI